MAIKRDRQQPLHSSKWNSGPPRKGDRIREKTGPLNGANNALGRCFADTEICTYQNKTVTAGPLLIKNTRCAYLLGQRMTEIAEKSHRHKARPNKGSLRMEKTDVHTQLVLTEKLPRQCRL